jgi:hypothetical protein
VVIFNLKREKEKGLKGQRVNEKMNEQIETNNKNEKTLKQIPKFAAQTKKRSRSDEIPDRRPG